MATGRRHRLVTSHLRLVAKIAMGIAATGCPISEVISEGNVGLMQAVKRSSRTRASGSPPMRCGWIKAAIQEYILPLVVAGEDGHHRQPEEAVLQPAQGPRAGFSRSRRATCPTRSSSSPSGWT